MHDYEFYSLHLCNRYHGYAVPCQEIAGIFGVICVIVFVVPLPVSCVRIASVHLPSSSQSLGVSPFGWINQYSLTHSLLYLYTLYINSSSSQLLSTLFITTHLYSTLRSKCRY